MNPPPLPAMPGINLGLTRITTLLALLRSPHLSTPIIHISGTNGKGSTAAYLASILVRSGVRVGRFTSPHLVDEWDGLEVGGVGITREVYEDAKGFVERVDRDEGVGATSFEVLAATAFEVFRRTQPRIEVAIVEVGMGGATDATNVVDAERTLLSVVTSIELDHQKFLGDTLREIALVKAGIIKRGGEAVVAKQQHQVIEDVLEEVATSMNATVYFAGEGTPSPTSSLISLPLHPIRSFPPTPSTSTLHPITAHLPLPGSYQRSNAASATLAAQILRSSPRILSIVPSLSNISDGSIRDGIEATKWAGRLDWVTVGGRQVLVDGAHNPSSAILLAEYLAELPEGKSPTTLIVGLSAPRDPRSILQHLLKGPIRRVVCVRFERPAGMDWIVPTATTEIASIARTFEGVEVGECETVEEALASVEAGQKVVVAGSLYLAADVYRLQRRTTG